MSIRNIRWRRYSLGIAFLAVLLPLAVLLALQYRTLVRLQQVSTAAHAAVLGNYLEAVVADTRNFYLTLAERSLNVPAGLILDGRPEEVERAWQRSDLAGARLLFLVDRTREVGGRLHLYDPVAGRFQAEADSQYAGAIAGALARWAGTRLGAEGEGRLRVDEHDPEYRLILNPIIGESGQAIGLAGMILDEDYFKLTLLPLAIEGSLPAYFPDMERNHLLLRVRDRAGDVVLATRKTPVEGDPLRRPFAMVFGDWTLEIQSTGSASARLARDNFVLVLTLSVLLGSLLIATIALALRAADRTLRLSDMKSEFVSNVSHELRTPVASIRVFGELLRLGRANSPEKSREYGAAIEGEARRLSDLIDNILDFSRIESGRKTYRLVRTDLASLVATTVETFRVRLIDSGVDLEYQPPRDPLPEVEADPDAIGLALNNLLDNAVKYSGDSRRVLLRLFPEDGSVVLAIQDFGIGIPEAEQKKIFERFHRVGTGLVHDVKGSGLGLAIVHHIMKAHRGRVTVRSVPGEGSLFSLVLPQAPPVPEAGAVPDHPTARRAPVAEPDPRVGRG